MLTQILTMYYMVFGDLILLPYLLVSSKAAIIVVAKKIPRIRKTKVLSDILITPPHLKRNVSTLRYNKIVIFTQITVHHDKIMVSWL